MPERPPIDPQPRRDLQIPPLINAQQKEGVASAKEPQSWDEKSPMQNESICSPNFRGRVK